MSDLETIVKYSSGRIGVIQVNNPPVNALSTSVRKGLLLAIETFDDDSNTDAILILGAGKAFIAGADIREFGKPPLPPRLSQVCNRIEACRKPVVASIHGPALGGGLEVAMAAHYRVASRSSKLGLPEVALGLLPGGGGTQRAPRLIGARAAADLMLSGSHMSASDALACGLIDKIVDSDDPLAVGLSYTRDLVDSGAGVRRTRDLAYADSASELAALQALTAGADAKNRQLYAPGKIIECIEAALTLTFDAGLDKESASFAECMSSPQRAGLIHAFFAERQVSKIPEIEGSSLRAITKVAIIGGGTMGAGIAVSALDAGFHVTMIERDQESIDRGRKNVEKVYDGLIAKGKLAPAAKLARLANFTTSEAYDALKDVDLVIEAVFEDINVKKAVFRELDRVCKPGTILATNTSYLDIDEIAAATARPQDVIGLHFFSPANVMKLLEIVVPAKVAQDVVATSFALAKALKKTPVRAGVCDGFIGNRILATYKQALDHVLEDGASPYEIDAALRGFGYPMGPFQVTDLSGGDIGWATRKRKAATRDPKARYVEIADRICERGWFGQKTGRGFYLYPNGTRQGQPDPEVLEIVDAERKRKGIMPRTFTADDIVQRFLCAMVNEGAKILEEGIALRPSDIDVTFLSGYGFPRYRGGPMKWADMQGLDQVLASIEKFAQEDPLFWKPSSLLKDLVSNQQNFQYLNDQRVQS
jgi:3-hydroxyacyl-CoA dehydrogenase